MRTLNFRGKHKAGKPVLFSAAIAFACFLLAAFMPIQVFAAPNTGAISTSFKSIYNIIAAIVTSIGQLYLLWGVFEWATSLNSQDGTAQSMAFTDVVRRVPVPFMYIRSMALRRK